MNYNFEVLFTVYSQGGTMVESGMNNITTMIQARDPSTAQAMVEGQYGGYDRKVIVHGIFQR